MPEYDIVFDTVPAKIEIAVFHPQLLSAIGILLDSKWRYLTAIENLHLPDLDLDLSCRNFKVLVASLPNLSKGLDDIFPSKLSRLTAECSVSLHIEHELCNAVPVAEIHKCHSSKIPRSLNPAAKGDLSARIGKL